MQQPFTAQLIYSTECPINNPSNKCCLRMSRDSAQGHHKRKISNRIPIKIFNAMLCYAMLCHLFSDVVSTSDHPSPITAQTTNKRSITSNPRYAFMPDALQQPQLSYYNTI